MTDFEKALAFVFHNEGGYSDHPADKGGRTNRGITQARLNDAHKKGIVSHNVVKILTKEEAAQIYEAYDWKGGKCDKMIYPLNVIHFDTTVLHGRGGAAKILQRALTRYTGEYVADDGIIGKQTLSFLEKVAQDKMIDFICKFYLLKRSMREQSIVINNPTQKVFLKGWTNRTERCRQYALKNGGVRC